MTSLTGGGGGAEETLILASLYFIRNIGGATKPRGGTQVYR